MTGQKSNQNGESLNEYEVIYSDDGYNLMIRDLDWSEQYVFNRVEKWAEGRGDRHIKGDTDGKLVYCGDSSGVPASSKLQDTTEEIPDHVRKIINKKTDYEIADKFKANWSSWGGRPEFSEFKIVLPDD